MADVNNNNNNNNNNNQIIAAAADNNNADEVADHLFYQPDLSTTCIVCSDFSGNNFVQSLTDHYLPPFFFQPHTSAVSSSFGLLLCNRPYAVPYHTAYFIGNPFSQLPYLPLPLCRQPPNTHTVLVVEPQGGPVIFHVICLLPFYREQGGYISYAINSFSDDISHPNPYWSNLFPRTRLLDDDGVSRIVIPDSGISCGRWAYWLTTAVTGTGDLSVLRVDVNPSEYPILTYLRFPQGLDSRDVTKLGRVRYNVGLVVASETRRRVEMYIMNQRDPNYGDDEPMVGWTLLCFLNVCLNPEMMDGVVEVMPGSNYVIRCREMPVPLKFESLANMQVLLLVGGRRLVLWANSRVNPESTRAVVLPREVPPLAGPLVEDRGIAHVGTSWEPWELVEMSNSCKFMSS